MAFISFNETFRMSFSVFNTTDLEEKKVNKPLLKKRMKLIAKSQDSMMLVLTLKYKLT